MTALFVTSLRNPVAADCVTVAAESALATLKRGVAGGEGTLWERIAESVAVSSSIRGTA